MLETSLHAQVVIPLITSVAFGLVSTTLLIMLVVSTFYAALDYSGLASPAAAPRGGLEPTPSSLSSPSSPRCLALDPGQRYDA